MTRLERVIALSLVLMAMTRSSRVMTSNDGGTWFSALGVGPAHDGSTPGLHFPPTAMRSGVDNRALTAFRLYLVAKRLRLS